MYSKKIVIIGATSCIAENCAKLWAIKETSPQFFLVGRNLKQLQRNALDLKVRNPNSSITCITTNFTDPKKIEQTVRKITSKAKIDIVLIAHGALPDQKYCQNDIAYCRENLEINGLSPVLFAECFAKRMEKLDYGSIAIIGSVAGDRGRKSNYVYGSSKALIEKYCEGLQHRFYKTNVKIILIKPGPTNTPMTKNLKKENLAPVNIVSDQIIKSIDKKALCSYTPKKWRLIMAIIKIMPGFIFKKINI
jgi:decaprenylphospho-beta-D-erythro-pentofuranosid-2-ulose 2-reductase